MRTQLTMMVSCACQVTDTALPVPRAEHGALVDPSAQVAYIVGGHDDHGQLLAT